MNDDPKTWGLPAPRLQWEVFAVDKKGKACSRAVYVCAPTQERAIAAGKYWRKVVGMKAAKVVVARRYYPQHDLERKGGGMNNEALVSRLSNARAMAHERLPAPDVQAIDDAILTLGQATSDEIAVIQNLIDLARQIDHALDYAEEVDCDGYRAHNIAGQDFDDVVEALEALNDLPDDQPGMTLGPAGKAEWALRRMLTNTGNERP